MVTMARNETHREARARGQQETTNARLLGWLLAYPASSAAELASTFGLHPATVYRHLGRMRAAGWLEQVSGYGGEARFLLTPRGTALLAQIMQQQSDQLARRWQRGLNSSARLVPRLLTIDQVQTFARPFFQYAPLALARQGRPVLVRWHVMRDWQARLEVTANRAISIQAQAVLAWTLTASPQDSARTWATERKHPEEVKWYSAFLLLESGLCDADLITARLRVWLRYRTWLERERASPASSCAPLLALVQNERQAELWRRAAHKAARRENADPLVGAIAILSEQENPWQWAWRDLATGAHLRLAAHLASLAPGSLPEGALAHLRAVQALMHACGQRNNVTLVKAAEPPGSLKRFERQASLATGSQVFSPRQQEALTQLARTPQMTAEELAAVLPRLDGEPLAASSAGRLLRDLARQGLIERDLVVQESQAVWRWHLTESGLRQVAAMHEVSLRHLRRQAERMHWMMQRQAAHQAGVYQVIAAFHLAAQTTKGKITVRWWESGRGAERSYRYHGVQRNLRPDAELELALRREGEGVSRRLRLWLEYDTGSMNRRDLSRKMAAYRDYWNAREWAAEGLASLPRLLFIVPEHGQEDRLRAACCAMLAGVRLRVLVTTAAHSEAETPCGRVWRQVWPLPEREESEREKRRMLWE